MSAEEIDRLVEALAAPFDPSEVRFKPQAVSGNRALAIAYVDARTVQDRLDEVLGVAGWQDSYELLPDGSVVCRLRLRLGDEWITKMDVGGPSEQPDQGDRVKAAFSDALKRAAVKFGIGRYLYRLPSEWVDYDPRKKQIVRPPALPPAVKVAGAAGPAPAKAAPPRGPRLPKDGKALLAWLARADEVMAAEFGWTPGDLLDAVKTAGVERNCPPKVEDWSGDAIRWAVEEARRQKAAAPRPHPDVLAARASP